MHVRIATYNIHHGRGVDGIIDLPGLAEVMEQTGADIIGLQEVDQFTQRCNGVDQTAELAQRLGFNGQFAAHFPYQGGYYGVAVITRFPIIAAKQYSLPTAPGCEARTLMQTTLDIHGVPVDFYNTHLEVRQQIIRELQCNTVADVLELGTLPTILTGDMNATPGGWDRKGRIASQLWDCDAPENQATFPSGAPSKRIDYVLASSHWSATEQGVTIFDSIRSDHVMVIADLVLKSASA
jgi:endonuclease/exonuclease/phosphatase family metal-dependent hydrolase